MSTLTLPGMDHEARDTALSQYFTPVELAARVWLWSGAHRSTYPLRVLEPSCGSGNIIAGMQLAGVEPRYVHAYDVDPRMAQATRARFATWNATDRLSVWCGDFMREEIAGDSYDLAVINPPYHDGLDVAITGRCLAVCTRVVGIYRADVFYSKARLAFWQDIAEIRRIAFLSKRPNFGGEHGAMTDFVVLELRRAIPGVTTQTASLEWWT